jgi:uracil-DNA glycosylase
MMGSKVRSLVILQDEILSSVPDPWLFPTRGSVKGFLGTSAVMLVAERPSTGSFGGPADYLLYSLLEKYGVADAHLTDVIKSRGKVGDPYPVDMSAHRRVFDREIEILKPRLVLAFGKKVYDLLQFSLAGSGISVRAIWHYSYARRGAAKAAAFEQQFKQVLDERPAKRSTR